MSFLKVKPLEPFPQEKPKEFLERLKAEEAKSRQWKWFLVGAGCFLLAVCFVVATSAVRNSNNYFDLKAQTELKIAKLEGENTALKGRKPEQIFTGMTTDQCMAKAETMVQNAVKSQCQGKTVAGPIRWRAAPTVAAAPTSSVRCTSGCQAPKTVVEVVEPAHHVCQVFHNDKLVADFGNRNTNYLHEYVKPHGEGPKCAALRARYFKDHPNVRFDREVKS